MLRRLLCVLPLALTVACSRPPGASLPQSVAASPVEPVIAEPADPATIYHAPPVEEFELIAEQFKDIQILRYEVPGFAELPLEQKKLLYFLSEAALHGRDMTWDQLGPYNLRVRRTLEAIWRSYSGDRTTPDFAAFQTYTKQVWFSSGIHHHYSGNKLVPGFSAAAFAAMVKASDASLLPLAEGEDADALIATLSPVLFDPEVEAKRTNRDPAADPIRDSANNFYQRGLTEKDVEDFYKRRRDPNDAEPIWHGLNSKLIRDGKTLAERPWKVGGMYSPAIKKVVHWLEKASEVAENPAQKDAIDRLVAFYRSGDLKDWNTYNVAWVKDVESLIDTVNGFIEVYDDALGMRATYEAVVSFKDLEATKRIAAIAKEAQWFEDNSPLLPEHKKKDVVGITAKVITVVMEAGASAPSTPIGINLPNADWIRKTHGSKSVSLGNIVASYDKAKRSGGVLEEFAASPEEIARAREYGSVASALHTDMHEVIGHASGQINPGVGSPKETLKSYASALEEARADLVALYYVMDPKLIELGVSPSVEVGKAEYDSYIRNGMMVQLARLAIGEELEESHMRNRQLVASWAYEKGKADKVIERVEREGKTYFVVNDYDRLRAIFGELLKEIQRIKSTGDFEAGKALIEDYGVKVDQDLHRQVLARYGKLGIAPYSGFLQPRLVPIEFDDEIIDVIIEYPADFAAQMLDYAEKYSHLPNVN
ncbi:MAG: dihydrofolate reductase [Myxococcales bacterium]|nr:dihydrofolate reductase [Myxococcales bacterium]MCB9568150.1 dihydrofolate reductase [Myxococcales bacterium]MCB9705377.1 dihydrofolate reductase [Myxococcales bacterium]